MVSDWHIAANYHADTQATEACQRAKLPNVICRPIMEAIHLIHKIQKRLSAIICSLPARGKFIKPKVLDQPKTPLADLAFASSHFAVDVGNKYTCVKCRQSALHNNYDSCRSWLFSKCPGHEYVPMEAGATFQIGKHVIHHSHQPRNHKGLIFCMHCGYCSTSQRVDMLAEPCPPAPPKHSIRIRDNILKDILPPNCKGWPQGDTNSSSTVCPSTFKPARKPKPPPRVTARPDIRTRPPPIKRKRATVQVQTEAPSLKQGRVSTHDSISISSFSDWSSFSGPESDTDIEDLNPVLRTTMEPETFHQGVMHHLDNQDFVPAIAMLETNLMHENDVNVSVPLASTNSLQIVLSNAQPSSSYAGPIPNSSRTKRKLVRMSTDEALLHAFAPEPNTDEALSASPSPQVGPSPHLHPSEVQGQQSLSTDIVLIPTSADAGTAVKKRRLERFTSAEAAEDYYNDT